MNQTNLMNYKVNKKYMKLFHNSKGSKVSETYPFENYKACNTMSVKTLLWIVGYFDVMTNEFMTTIASPGNLHSIVFLHILTG